MSRRVVSIAAAAIAFGLLAAAPRCEAAADPRVFVNQLGDQGIETLGANIPPEQRLARFRELFRTDFDVTGIGRFAIGRYWAALNPDQQQEFLHLYQEYTVQAYADKLGQYGGAQFQVTGAENMGDETVVHSAVIRQNGAPVQMDWHVMQKDGGYKVTDVFVDRVSMKVTQRDEFAKIIQNNGGQPAAILAVLRQQLHSEKAPAPTTH
ncbi:MAG TPA: ABC transporter substrate-binding protein [Stellaceae bacterium]|jgi:phospholipid transport system substrate-binding protein|nr:ABC transporter substrate-binding protein [Stellaceae bacterium]